MRSAVLLLFLPFLIRAQRYPASGTWTNSKVLPTVTVTINADSTFTYASPMPPELYSEAPQQFRETGRWTMSGDTMILNPGLDTKTYIESELVEDRIDDDSLRLEFVSVQRYFNDAGHIIRSDTSDIGWLDYAFDAFRKRNKVRIADRDHWSRTFSGPQSRILLISERSSRTIPRPARYPQRLYVGCPEMGTFKAYPLRDSSANRLRFYVYSNHYPQQLRSVKWLVKDGNTIYITRKKNGAFLRDPLDMELWTKLRRNWDNRRSTL